MRDPNRIDSIVKRLATVWKRYPELRLGQLIENTLSTQLQVDLFYIEDEVLVRELENYKAGYKNIPHG